MSDLITLQGCSKTYGKVRALMDVSLDIPAGSIVGILGHNGAGKTTLLKCLMGLTSYDGQVQVMGKDAYAHRQDLLNHISFISDTATLPPWMRVQEILWFMSKLHPQFNVDVARDFLKETSIPMNQKINQLSKGMIVQLHLSLVMAVNSNILILDEPTLGLDLMYRHIFYTRLIERYFDENKTIIISSHHLDEVEHLLTHAAILKQGQLISQGSLEELKDTHWQSTLAGDHLQRWGQLGRAVQGRGLDGVSVVFDRKPEDLTYGRPASLSEIFLFHSQLTEAV